MKKIFLSVVIILGLGFMYKFFAQNSYKDFDTFDTSSINSYNIDYTLWNSLLQKYVDNNGFVNYKDLKDDEAKLLKFTSHLSQNTPNDSWTENQKKAYLINAYNAFTLQLVIENYPVESIRDIGGFLSNVFNKDFIEFNGEMISLDDIEKGMLLPMGDARVHFAVNCASFSCPKLDNKAFLPENLDQHLDQTAKSFLNSERNIIKNNEIKLSKIFKWYKSDFEKQAKSLIDFINLYSENKIKPDAKIDYLDYNWNLNSITNRVDS